MKTNKNIDRLFQEKLKDFEVSPPDTVWKDIEHRLKNKNSKSIFPLWMRIGSAAVIGLMFIIGGVRYFNNTDTNIITNTNIEDLPKVDENEIKTKLLESFENDEVIATEIDKNNQPKIILSKKHTKKDKEEIINYKNKIIVTNTVNNTKNSYDITASKTKNSTIHKNYKKLKTNKGINTPTNSYKKVISPEKNKGNFNTQVALNTSRKKEENLLEKPNNIVDKNTIKVTENQNRIANNSSNENIALEKEVEIATAKPVKNQDNLLKEKLVEDFDIKQKEDTKKWNVASLIAPVYYNSFNDKGSPLDTKFKDNPKQGSKTISYGFKVGYKISKKLSLQSGVSLVNVGYKISDVYINPSQQSTTKLTNVDYTNTGNLLNINTVSYLGGSKIETASIIPAKGILNQEFGYIEVPLELKYSLRNSNRKLGVNLIGGFSTLFLNKNDVFVETSQFSSNLGEANNLNNINFSGNLGIDVDYKINKNLYFNIAPMFKIHANTFSKNNGNFNPYVLGVYTGLNYKF